MLLSIALRISLKTLQGASKAPCDLVSAHLLVSSYTILHLIQHISISTDSTQFLPALGPPSPYHPGILPLHCPGVFPDLGLASSYSSFKYQLKCHFFKRSSMPVHISSLWRPGFFSCNYKNPTLIDLVK